MSGGIINTLFALAFAVILVAVFWGLVMYFAEMGSDEAKKEHKGIVIGSITALFLLMCLYAVVEWLRSLAGI
ncbi:MAG: hypothetical protein Q7R71_01300 [bacterium]|nr:hypothetical protein [bacterium]